MQEAWITVQCPHCEETWEAEVDELPAPDDQFQCDNCDDYGRTSEFAKTPRDLEVLRDLS